MQQNKLLQKKNRSTKAIVSGETGWEGRGGGGWTPSFLSSPLSQAVSTSATSVMQPCKNHQPRGGRQNKTVYVVSWQEPPSPVRTERTQTVHGPGSAKLRRGSSPITHPLCAIRKQALCGCWGRDSSAERVMSSKGKVKYLRTESSIKATQRNPLEGTWVSTIQIKFLPQWTE